METMEYTTAGNTIGISIKYPDEIQQKWSEHHVDVVCDNCQSEDISSEISGDLLTVDCNDCENQWQGLCDKVLTWHDTEEALVSLGRIPFTER